MNTRRNLLLSVFVLSLGALIWSVLFKTKSEPISFKDFVGLLPTVVSLLGATQEQKPEKATRRGKKRPSVDTKAPRPLTIAKPFRLGPSFESGLYGGLIGGAMAGLIVSMSYYLSGQGWQVMPYIFGYATLTGMFLGASTQLAILGFCYLATEKQYPALVFNEVTGGILGGAIGGMFAGAVGGWLFGPRPEEFVNIGALVAGVVLGAVCIILGALLYDYEGRWRNTMRALLISAVISGIVATPGVIVLQSLDLYKSFFYYGTTVLQNAQGGTIIGLVAGIVLGLQIGLTLRIYRLWETASEPQGD